jgi:flagellar L-ring protein precursor FlgH
LELLKFSIVVLGLLATPAWAQPPLPPPAVLPGPLGPGAVAPVPLPPGPVVPRPPRVRDYSWIYLDAPPPPREIKVHDIITVLVDEKAEVTINSRFNRQRNGSLKAELKEFIKLGDNFNLLNAAENEPAIDTQVQSRMQATGQATDAEGIRYRIAATVVDVLPNGTIVLEARKTIRTNHEVFEYRLTGRIDSLKIAPNRSAQSEDIAEMSVVRSQKGKIFDSTKRGWGTVLSDWLFPF